MGEISRGPEPSPVNPDAIAGRKALYSRLSTAWHHAKEGIPMPGWASVNVDPATVALKPAKSSEQIIITHTRSSDRENGVSVTFLHEPRETAHGIEMSELNFSVRRDGYYEVPGVLTTRSLFWDEQTKKYASLNPKVQPFNMDDPNILAAIAVPLSELSTQDSRQ